jgi:hypothetical protein
MLGSEGQAQQDWPGGEGQQHGEGGCGAWPAEKDPGTGGVHGGRGNGVAPLGLLGGEFMVLWL